MIRALLICLPVTLALVACSGGTGVTPGASGLDAIKARFSGLTGQKQAAPTAEQLAAALTPDRLAQIGVPLILVDLEGKGIAAVMAEEGRNAGVVTYLDATRVALQLRDGIVVGTRGLGNDMMTTDVGAVLAVWSAGGAASRVHRSLDGENRLIATEYTCTLTRAGQTVTEDCSGPTGSFTNSYTLDPTGKPRASRQYLGAANGYARITHYN